MLQTIDGLKEFFTSTPILIMADSKRKYKIEVDISDYTTSRVFFQQINDKLWYSVVYSSKSMNDAKHNYKIYDKKLLIWALEE